ncbi:MAG: TonB-dependent receptor, partial [Bacteroidota bacterium]
LKFSVTFFLTVMSFFLFAQKTITLKGKVIDKSTKEALIGATVFLPEKNNGTNTNALGEFEITTNENTTLFKVAFIGYRDTTIKISSSNSSFYTITLSHAYKYLNEVQIVSSKDDPKEKVNDMQMGVERISMAEAKLLPAILGEVDILKVLQLKPGVKSGGEGTAGFFVRGGSNDQNLILVEHAPVYNPSHLFGFFSVFNSDAINNVTLYKSGFPSQYGGRLSSVLDVEMNKGQADSIAVQGGIGLLASRLTVNLPIIKKKLSILVSGRRTYADLITNSLNELNKNKPDFTPIPAYYFYDFNCAMEYAINDKNKLSLNGYFGNDFFKFKGDNFGANLLWGNRSATLEWNHRFNSRMNVSNAYFTSGYLYRINTSFSEISLSLGSRIWDQGLVSNWSYVINEKHKLKFGGSGIYHRFTVGEFGISAEFTDIKDGQNIEAGEFGAYLSHTWKINQRIEILSGIRNSTFNNNNKTFNNLEPRMAIKTSVNSNSTIKASYARMYQYSHLVSSSAASLPTDVWYPSEEGIQPQRSDQVSLGYHQAIAENKYFASIEGYYKWIDNAIDFRDGAQLFANPNLSNEFVFGKGWAYGIEAFVEKKKGKTTGWIGYTLSWSWRQFDKINYGIAFHPRFDRRHDISIVIMHKLNKRLSLSGTWVYSTGNFATIAGGRFAFQDALPTQISATPDYLRRNDFQMPPTHRLDLGLVWKLNTKKWESDITFSLYNAYSRRNPYFVFYEEIKDDAGQTIQFKPTLVSLFPILPAVTYNFKF